MKIRTQLLVALVIFGVIMLIVGGLAIVTSRRSAELERQADIALAVERGASDLGYLSDDYLLHREPQQRARWEEKWAAVSERVSELDPADPEQRAIRLGIRRSMLSLRAVFTDVADAFGSRAPAPPLTETFVQVAWSRMAVQNQGIAFDVSRLGDALREEREDIALLRERLTLILLALLGTYAFINLLIVFRRLLSSVAELRIGAKRIGSGDLDHTIAVKHADEIGELARAFNRMATELKTTTASKSELEKEIVERLSAEAALAETARENARLYEDEKQGFVYAETINRINDAIHATLDLDPVIDRVLKEATTVLNADMGAILLRGDDSWSLPYSFGIPVGVLPAMTDEESPLSVMIERAGGPAVIEDAQTDQRAEGDALRLLGARSLIGVPLTSRGRITGVLYFAALGEPVAFKPRQIDFAVKVTGTLSLAIENARLYANAYRVSDTLQTALLALPDSILGLEFAHAYRSSTEAARVGGDFYDLFELGDGQLGLTVGDISGKGLEAAVLTSLVKYTIRAHAIDGKSPAEVLRLTNRVVFRGSAIEAFTTVFFGVLDIHSGRLVYCNAGHTTVALVRAGGTVAGLSATSPIVGAFPTVLFRDCEASIGPADMLLMYTDGVTEARAGRSLFGEERLFELLSDTSDEAPATAVERVLDRVLTFAGGRLTDDVAILAIRLTDHRLSEAARSAENLHRAGIDGPEPIRVDV